MRHLNKEKKLNRNRSHLKSMLRNMIISLVCFEIIKTTSPKAKLLKNTIEPIINISKNDNFVNRKIVYSILKNKKTIKKLFEVLGPRFKKRKGGYTKIIKCRYRCGDGAKMSYILLTDYLKNKNIIL
ncbi:50S ribosomal protein L17 [Candidatus Annandia adelgestsuga]|uniref:50S ribosomal protein L17 n=1 Tax=Candidatus Annandia adelgestsuga TaxID=1302411 RepID=A0A3S9J7E0_9ENTR|nr:50S ribosomal protein L17 [Candidatus Annandia adelgestsuga]AZP36196.1 50S ribosomal protein L17 [Candidatus Annandia adelgestsuga]